MSMCHWHVTFLGEKIKYNEKKRKDTKKDLIPRSSSFTIFTHKRALGWIPFTNKQYFLSFALFIHLQMTLLKKKHDKEKWRMKRAMLCLSVASFFVTTLIIFITILKNTRSCLFLRYHGVPPTEYVQPPRRWRRKSAEFDAIESGLPSSAPLPS